VVSVGVQKLMGREVTVRVSQKDVSSRTQEIQRRRKCGESSDVAHVGNQIVGLKYDDLSIGREIPLLSSTYVYVVQRVLLQTDVERSSIGITSSIWEWIRDYGVSQVDVDVVLREQEVHSRAVDRIVYEGKNPLTTLSIDVQSHEVDGLYGGVLS